MLLLRSDVYEKVLPSWRIFIRYNDNSQVAYFFGSYSVHRHIPIGQFFLSVIPSLQWCPFMTGGTLFIPSHITDIREAKFIAAIPEVI